MSEEDLYISNGTCFYGPGEVSDDRFIPCGNAYLSGPQACCFQGDFCLSTGTCWDNDTIVTYTAGCTDSSYSSSKCIDKREYPDQQWVALARCDPPNVEIWSGCAKHPDVIVIEKENCDCDVNDPLIRNPNGASTLNEIASLPYSANGHISFNPTATPTFESAVSSTPASNSAAATSTQPASSGSSSSGVELSTGAKAGIGVGAGIAGLLIIALVFWVYKLTQRRKTAEAPPQPQQQYQQYQQYPPTEVSADPNSYYSDPTQPESLSPTSQPMTQFYGVSPEDHDPHKQDAQQWYGQRPRELSADSEYRPELQGDARYRGTQELQG